MRLRLRTESRFSGETQAETEPHSFLISNRLLSRRLFRGWPSGVTSTVRGATLIVRCAPLCLSSFSTAIVPRCWHYRNGTGGMSQAMAHPEQNPLLDTSWLPLDTYLGHAILVTVSVLLCTHEEPRGTKQLPVVGQDIYNNH